MTALQSSWKITADREKIKQQPFLTVNTTISTEQIVTDGRYQCFRRIENKASNWVLVRGVSEGAALKKLNKQRRASVRYS